MEPEEEATAEGGGSPAVEEPSSASPVWAWAGIVLSVLVIILGPKFLSQAASLEEAEDDYSSLAMLQIQVRPIIGIAPMQMESALMNLEKIASTGMTDRTAEALAVVHAFIQPGAKGQERAAEVLQQRLEAEGADTESLDQLRRAIEEGVTPEERKFHAMRLGWFAGLLPEHGTPESFPNAEKIYAEGFQTTIALVVFVLGGLLSLLIGAAILITGLVRLNQGNLRLSFVPAASLSVAMLESFALFLGGLAAGSLGSWLFHWLLYPALWISGMILAVFWPVLRGHSWNETRRAFGWHRGRGVFRELGAGIAGYLTVLPMALIGLGVMLLLSFVFRLIENSGAPDGVEQVSHPAVGWLLGSWKTKIMVLLFAAVVAPLVEETFFRGAFFGSLRGRAGFPVSALLTGFVFAAIHPQGLIAIPPLMAMGFGFAAIREWRDSLIAPMTAHAINNGLLISGMLVILS